MPIFFFFFSESFETCDNQNLVIRGFRIIRRAVSMESIRFRISKI